MTDITVKQQFFGDEFVKCGNETRAYMTAYPHVKNENVAAAAASRLLRNVKVKKYIDEQLEKISSEKVADAQEVMEYLTSVMRGSSESEVVVVESVGLGLSAAKRIEKLPDEKEKLKAAELLGKRFGLFKENVDLSGDLEFNIKVDYGNNDTE